MIASRRIALVLDQRLVARAVALALDPAFEKRAAGSLLAELAAGNRTALARALARLEAVGRDRQGDASRRAAAALRLALASVRGRDEASRKT